MNQFDPQHLMNDYADQEWYEQQERLKRADGVDFYSGFDKKAGRGILLNEQMWICDDCQSLKIHPDKKFKSLKCTKDFHLGVFVCEVCSPKHGYPQSNFSVEYFNESWHLGIEKFDNSIWVLPQKAKPLYFWAKIFLDLDTLVWSRRAEFGKNDPKVIELEKIKSSCFVSNDLTKVELWSAKEKFDIVIKSRHFYIPLLFIHQSIYQNNRSLPTSFKVVYPDTTTRVRETREISL